MFSMQNNSIKQNQHITNLQEYFLPQSLLNKLKMEAHQSNDDIFEDDHQATHQGFSLAEYSQTHPYQYLKQLNNVYQSCNKTTGKDFSSASKVKLPWKKFKPIAIPKCFEDSYNIARKQTCIQKHSDEGQKTEEQEKQKKFWKQHEELMKKYYKNNIEINHVKKKKIQQRRKNLQSAKSHSNLNTKNSFPAMLNQPQYSNKSQHTESSIKGQNKENHQETFSKNNQDRCSTLKTQSDKTHNCAQNCGFIPSRNSVLAKQRNLLVDKTLLKDKSNIFLKKIMQKGTDLAYDEVKLEQEVLQKLKKISMMPHFSRAKTANILSRQGVRTKQKQRVQNKGKIVCLMMSNVRESRVQQRQFLEFSRQQDLIKRYQKKIKDIDCSISQKNVKKTCQILREMQLLASVKVQDFQS